PGSRLHRAAGLCLASGMWADLRSLGRAGALSAAVWSDGRHAAQGASALTRGAAAARRGRAAARDHDPAQLRRLSRDDRVGESEPIAFDGDAWQRYVPLRLPWTRYIRERLPAGVEAVLINAAHTYPDLAVPINSAQARVVDAIDGKRSVDDILRSAAGAYGA